jgi:hypothetical protein
MVGVLFINPKEFKMNKVTIDDIEYDLDKLSEEGIPPVLRVNTNREVAC